MSSKNFYPAFAIIICPIHAARLGLAESIISDARNEVNPDELRADRLLDDIRKERNRSSREREKAEKGRQRIDDLTRELAGRLETDDEQRLGELVILVAGWQDPGGADQAEQERVLRILAADLPLRQAAGLTARLTGGRKNDLYRMGLDLGLGAGERDP